MPGTPSTTQASSSQMGLIGLVLGKAGRPQGLVLLQCVSKGLLKPQTGNQSKLSLTQAGHSSLHLHVVSFEGTRKWLLRSRARVCQGPGLRLQQTWVVPGQPQHTPCLGQVRGERAPVVWGEAWGQQRACASPQAQMVLIAAPALS